MSRHQDNLGGIDMDSQVIGFKHGTEKSERWSEEETKVLFLTEGIIMRQVMSHDEEKYPDSILPGCRECCSWMKFTRDLPTLN